MRGRGGVPAGVERGGHGPGVCSRRAVAAARHQLHLLLRRTRLQPPACPRAGGLHAVTLTPLTIKTINLSSFMSLSIFICY